MCAAVYHPFQFEVNIRKAAEHLVRVPPKTLPKPQLQPQSQLPFSVVKLRHVDQTLAETKPPPQSESADPPASPPSSFSAIQFMTRVLQRLREVDEHVSEVITVVSSISLTSFSSLSSFYNLEIVACSDPQKGAPEWMLIIHLALIIHLGMCNV